MDTLKCKICQADADLITSTGQFYCLDHEDEAINDGNLLTFIGYLEDLSDISEDAYQEYRQLRIKYFGQEADPDLYISILFPRSSVLLTDWLS
mgnify:CR=1 FL=1